jgi:hypothetical protein
MLQLAFSSGYIHLAALAFFFYGAQYYRVVERRSNRPLEGVKEINSGDFFFSF